jgi:ankyrin repeat protein
LKSLFFFPDYNQLISKCIKCEISMLSLSKASDNDSLLALLEQEGGDPNVTEDPEGYTCLMAAASAGHLHTVELLVSKGGDVNQTCTYGRTALFCAASKGHAHIVRHLVDHGAHVQLFSTCSDRTTPLITASHRGYTDVVSVLLEHPACDLDATNAYGETALIAAASYGHLGIVRALLSAHASVNIAQKYGATPIFCAAAYGHYEIVQELIAHDADTNRPNSSDGNTPVSIATRKGHHDIVRLLLTADRAAKE